MAASRVRPDMLSGVVPFPPDFAARYRAKGYWRDRSLAQEFAETWKKFGPRTALIDGKRRYAYADIDRLTDNLALNLLELGLNPLDRDAADLLQREIKQYEFGDVGQRRHHPVERIQSQLEQIERQIVGQPVDIGVGVAPLTVAEGLSLIHISEPTRQ